jgi:hypothetical protein
MHNTRIKLSRLRRPSFALGAALWLALFALSLPACASTDVHHLALTNWTDRHVTPDNRAAQWALTPVLIPVGVLTLTLDNVIVAPAVQSASALALTQDFWEASPEGYYSALAFLPFQIALTPVVFAGSWTILSFYGGETHSEAAWGWPEWGRQWRRDSEGRLIGPPEAEP